MLRVVLASVTVTLVVIHFIILYLWIFDWRKLVPQIGVFSWISLIILSIMIYFVYRKLFHNQKFAVIYRRVLFSSTLMIIVLAVLMLVIESITNSMP